MNIPQHVIKKEIEERAYEIWQFRVENNIPGCALGDWLAAEKEVNWDYDPKNKYNKNPL